MTKEEFTEQIEEEVKGFRKESDVKNSIKKCEDVGDEIRARTYRNVYRNNQTNKRKMEITNAC